MKRLIFIVIAALFMTGLRAQGIEFFHGEWEEALEKASEQNKLIFVDCYTTWCGPCRRMAANVFPQKDVGDFYNANFINLKLDMEKGQGLKFRDKYPVSAFPTFFWIDGDGKVVHSTKGARQAEDFIELGKAAVRKFDSSVKWEVQYEDGDRSYEVVYNYIKSLNQNDKPSLKVTNDYLLTQDDLTTDDNLRIILEGAVEVDSRPFEYLETYKSEIVKLEGEEAVAKKIRVAARATAAKAGTYEVESLLEEAVSAIERHLPDEADEFATKVSMGYAQAVRDPGMYYQHAKRYVKKYIDKEPWHLSEVSMTILRNFTSDEDLRKLGEDAAAKALALEPTTERTLTYATLLYIGGDKKGAINVIDDAIKEAGDDDRTVRKLETIKRKFESA